MLTYPEIDPILFQLGPLKMHWYGAMYLIAFMSGWWLGRLRANTPNAIMKPDDIDDMIFYGALGVVLGGRIGYTLFYNFSSFIDEPVSIFYIWKGGMSFHGGLLGVIIAFYLFARNHKKSFFQVSDFMAPMVPIGLGAGRIGNFINKELIHFSNYDIHGVERI